MVVYKVFCKNYELKKGELMGMLIERRKDLRGMNPVESGLRWAKMTFGRMAKDQKTIFVIPNELKLSGDTEWLMEKGIFTREESKEIVKLTAMGGGDGSR
jgi:hypothetical protein